jgi:hypothetical protein
MIIRARFASAALSKKYGINCTEGLGGFSLGLPSSEFRLSMINGELLDMSDHKGERASFTSFAFSRPIALVPGTLVSWEVQRKALRRIDGDTYFCFYTLCVSGMCT